MLFHMIQSASPRYIRGSLCLSSSKCSSRSTTSLYLLGFRARIPISSSSQTHQYSAVSKHLGTKHGRGPMSLPVVLLASGISAIGLGIWSQQNSPTLNDAPPDIAQETEKPVEGLDSIEWKRKVYPGLDLVAANTKLRAEEKSTRFRTRSSTGPTRFDSIRVPSNSPCEDQRSYGAAHVGETNKWKFWGVYDGHAGWATARILRVCLTNYVAQAIQRAKEKSPLSPESIDNAIKNGFLELDNEIIQDGLEALSDKCEHAEAVSRIAPARAGSCALLAIFDPANTTLRVACTGDSRAVLGRCATEEENENQQCTIRYTAEVLSEDQTGFNEKEVERIDTEHPGEADVIDKSSGRVMGLAVTRAFGDHRWKWPLEAINKCRSQFYGQGARPNYKSPPYLTAEPEIRTTKVGKGDFLIMASDGLWDHMSSEHAVECVGMWIEQEQAMSRNDDQTSEKSSPILGKAGEPVTDEKQKELVQEFSYWYRGTPDNFVVEDRNAATHLVRNAFGGGRRELFCSVMSVQAPDSRNVRDDVTVQVIFFGDVLSGVAADSKL